MRLADFAGDWRIARVIEDRLAGRAGRLDGAARFVPDDGGLVCDERGTLRFAGAPPLQAERRYLWRASGGRIAVLFADGRPFHDFAPADTATATHDCPPDAYAVRYDFTAWPDWTATWDVTGPRKDYRMTTRYRPA